MNKQIKLGISSCLLGARVRFDGGHKQDNYIVGTLGQGFEFVSICPEMGIGLGAPRPTLRLVEEAGQIYARGVRDPNWDVTEALNGYLDTVADALAGISGYVFKKGSPSCGVERVRVYSPAGIPTRKGSGLFAARFRECYPWIPVEEEGRLGDPVLRENFFVRVFTLKRWQSVLAEGLTAGKLVEFHAQHKYIVMAHNQTAYQRLGQQVAAAKTLVKHNHAQSYIVALMEALQRRATRKSHANVLFHLAGYLKKQLPRDDVAELNETIDQYREGLWPLLVPLTLLKHHFRKHPNPYIEQQIYLNPHPVELMLRNGL
jgi:uncharacterized protein YbgA (DUF1722 family)/uncharacterized protein YbbK (DUF523 family)